MNKDAKLAAIVIGGVVVLCSVLVTGIKKCTRPKKKPDNVENDIPHDDFSTEAESENNDGMCIKIIGVGGGGNNTVNRMIANGYEAVNCVVIDTDKQVLRKSKTKTVMQIGKKLARGLGSGGNCGTSREAADGSREEIAHAICGADIVFIAAGMGGGIGTGAAPVIANIAKELGIPTVAVVTVPFTFEGRKRVMQAQMGVSILKKECDAVVVFQDDKLLEGNLSILEAFKQADDILKDLCAQDIAELIARAFADGH